MTSNVNVLNAANPELPVPGRTTQEKVFDVLIWGGLIVLLVWSFKPADMHRMGQVFIGGGNMAMLLEDFLKPNFRYWHSYFDLMLETVQMAVWGSFLSVILAVPFGLLSSSNIAPYWIVFPVRRLMDAFRAINELVFALIFVAAVGLGPLAGVLALMIHTTGTLAKLFSEAVEAIDPRPVEGIKATGAPAIQEIVYGVVPQVLPLWISYSLYRFESNVRSATVLGIVGAGGIGMSLSEALRGFDYSAGAAILLIILVTVSLLDIFGSLLRKVVIDGTDHGRFASYFLFLAGLVAGLEVLLAHS
ncbi:phosphonate ABC transporter, permease protein PhnE [Labrenzia sp. PHM005]|uniref:phosphonate ABC transporter, permease protein PhnE n=1 Tax=Labrenzia sp. PHM005 TaxID=2590016 RepID=UPI00113FD0D0|nr:phosphonate ABC transporter, permease protein PhnE [Labrenzia sp. PHM005]QDG77234.1 phosphonate ABC transporter, permease protein PhnE [Labrenzia sp. PHM005]